MNTRQRRPNVRMILTVATLALGLITATGCQKHDDDHDQEHGSTESFSQPHSYAEAVELIHTHLAKIDDLIEAKQLDRVHAQAAIVRDVAMMMPKLALKKASGVPKEAIKEINLASKDLAAKFGPIDEAGDSGNRAGTQKVYDEMVRLFETLEKFADSDHDHD